MERKYFLDLDVKDAESFDDSALKISILFETREARRVRRQIESLDQQFLPVFVAVDAKHG